MADTKAAQDTAGVARQDVVPLVTGYEQLRERYRSFRPRDSAAMDATQQHDDPALTLGGLVVDETQTRLGRLFYDTFYQHWEAPEGAVHFTVTVRERPLPGRGTLLSVHIDEEIAFRVRLRPRAAFVERAAQSAAQRTIRRLRRAAGPGGSGS